MIQPNKTIFYDKNADKFNSIYFEVMISFDEYFRTTY